MANHGSGTLLDIYAGQMIWSKLDSGRLPNLQEITLHIEEQQFTLKKNNDIDEYSFPEDAEEKQQFVFEQDKDDYSFSNEYPES